jgi:tetratricopeptide (TPR) repeat protein
MRGTAALVSIVIAAAALPVMVHGQDNRQAYRECYQGDVAAKVIAACSNLINNRLGERNDLAMAYKSRGDAYDDTERYELALRDYSEAIALNPQDATAFNSRGTTRTALGQYELALGDFDRALRLVPAQAIPLSNRCFAKAALGRLEDALADCNEAVRLHPARFSTFGSRGFVYLKLGRADEAIADYERVLAKRPDDPYALYGRAAARRITGDRRGSDDDVVRALAIKPDIAEHMDRLGVRLGQIPPQR